MKKLSPPSAARRKPFKMPPAPLALVFTSSPGLIDTIAPASAITDSPESSDSVASAYAGPYLMACSMTCLPRVRRARTVTQILKITR